MGNFQCPQCCEETITLKQKLKAGKWSTIFCPNCNARMCSNPIALALMYFVLTWNLLFFGYMAIHEKSINYAIAMVVGWAILEFFITYIPLNRMRALTSNNSSKNSPNNNN